MATQEALYRYHAENYRAVARGFRQTSELLERALGAEQDEVCEALTRVGVFLLSAKVEARFYKLLFEPPVPEEFRSLVDRRSGGRTPSLFKKWRRTVRIAFGEYYGFSGDFNLSAAPPEAKSQYRSHLTSVARLEPIIELRNKVAHGQWRYALNRDGDALNQDKSDQLAAETLLSLRLKDRLTATVADGVNDLVVSKAAHDRDLTKHHARLDDTLRELDTRSYEKYVANIRARARRAHNKRRAAVGKPPL